VSLPLVVTAAAPRFNAAKLDALLREGIQRRKIPAVSAAVATQSIFGIAPMTKAITTVAALQLVEQGKLSLHDPIGKFLPEFTAM